MNKFKIESEVNIPVGEAWSGLLDVESWPKWVPGITKLEKTQKENVFHIRGERFLPTKGMLRVDVIADDRCIVFTRTFPGIQAMTTYKLRESPDNNTRIEYETELGGWIGRLPEFGLSDEWPREEVEGFKAFVGNRI